MVVAPPPTRLAPRYLALTGAGLVGLGVVVFLALHVLAPEVDPVRRTLSRYALGPWKPALDAGVLAVAAVLVMGLWAARAAPRVSRGRCSSLRRGADPRAMH